MPGRETAIPPLPGRGVSLTTPSHGCVHLTIGSARYYHDHLPIGAEVAVF